MRIGLDADGVLLNYNLAWGAVWAKASGMTPTCVEPRAYHATTYWGVEAPPAEAAFWALFDQEGWQAMAAMDGAVQACQRLVDAGHTLVCVTSMPAHRQQARLDNLKALGFPIEQVVATGHCEDRSRNPKQDAIAGLDLDWFVDDELRKLKDLGSVRCVLVDPGHPDSPNDGHSDAFLVARVTNLTQFADLVLAGQIA
jgi:hypothetical protein